MIIEYNIFKSDEYNLIYFKIFLKGLIVVDKRQLEVGLLFAISWTIFNFCGPNTHDTNAIEWKEMALRATDKYF